MRSSNAIENLRRWLLLGAALLLLAGCGSPPSVLPLLQVTAGVLQDESQRLQRDAERAASAIQRDKASLAAAFERDLAQRDHLDAQWVRNAVSVYAAARDALSEQSARVASAYASRLDNLDAAADANRRAITLLEHHRRALPWPEQLDAWRLRDRLLSASRPAVGAAASDTNP